MVTGICFYGLLNFYIYNNYHMLSSNQFYKDKWHTQVIYVYIFFMLSSSTKSEYILFYP